MGIDRYKIAIQPVSRLSGVLVFLVMVLLIVLERLLTGFPGVSWLAPWLVASGVFYWMLFRPQVLPLVSIFVLGLIEDGLTGMPFGFHGLGLVALAWLADRQQQYLLQQPFQVVWLSFAMIVGLVMAMMMVVQWLLSAPVTLWPAAVWAVTALSFPLVYMPMMAAYRLILREKVAP